MVEGPHNRRVTTISSLIGWPEQVLTAIRQTVSFQSILAAFGAVLVLGCWSVLLTYLRNNHVEREASLLTQHSNTAIAASQSIANDVGQVDLLVKLLAEMKEESHFHMPIYDLRHVFALKGGLFHVSFVDQYGNVGGNTAFPIGTQKVNIADRAHFVVHNRETSSRALYISRPLMGRGTGKYSILFSRGIYGEKNKFLGAAVAGLAPEALLGSLNGLDLGSSSGIALVGADDTISAGVGSFADQIGRSFREYTVVRVLAEADVQIFERTVNGALQWVAIRRLPGYELSVILVSDAPKVRAISTYEVLLLVCAVLLTVMVGILIVLGRRQIDVERLEISLREQIIANETQRNFITMASHEFRTPLAIIDSSAQKVAARAETLNPTLIAGRARTIRGAVRRMTDLMESILVVAKIDKGELELKTSSFALGTMLGECVARASELEPIRQLEVDIARLNTDVLADMVLLEQAVSNLLSNAMKYSPADKPILVTGWRDESGAKILIADQGIGIHESEIPKLFSRYFRAKTAEGIAGTGIGLYFVKLIIEKHGGTVGVTSKLGVGTTFTINLPPVCLVSRATVRSPILSAA